jgi:hypothetical protein
MSSFLRKQESSGINLLLDASLRWHDGYILDQSRLSLELAFFRAPGATRTA